MGTSSSFKSIVLFLCWPFLAFVIAIKNFNSTYSKNIIWIFCIYFGISFSISTQSQRSDITRYLAGFENLKLEDKEISSITNMLYVPDGYNDAYYILVSYFAAKMQFPAELYLGLIGLVFGFFYSRIFKVFANGIGSRYDLFNLLLFLTFLMIVPIWRGINGIRFSLAAVMFVYSVLSIYNGKIKAVYIVILLLTPIVHFSMLSIVLLSVFFVLIRNLLNINILFVGYIFSLLFVQVDLEQLNVVLNNYAPELFSSKIDAYARTSYIGEIEQRVSNNNWYALWYFKALNYAAVILMLLIFKYYNRLININPKVKPFLFFLFFISIFSNISSLVPSGSRMSLISIMLTLYFFSEMYQDGSTNLQRSFIRYFIAPLLIFYNLIQLRIGAEFISLETLVGNPFISLLGFEKYSVMDIFR